MNKDLLLNSLRLLDEEEKRNLKKTLALMENTGEDPLADRSDIPSLVSVALPGIGPVLFEADLAGRLYAAVGNKKYRVHARDF